MKSLGRIGLKAIIYFEIATTVALVIGLALVNIFKPGAGSRVPARRRHGGASPRMAQNQQHAWDLFLHLFPTSVVDAMARGDILQVVVFATFFGVARGRARAEGQACLDLLESDRAGDVQGHGLCDGAARRSASSPRLARRSAAKASRCSLTLGKLVALMYLGLALFVLIVVVGVSLSHSRAVPDVPARAIREPFLIAFSTASSEAALPKALEVMERFGVPKHIVVVRAADRLQLQSRWHHAVPVAGERVRRADGRRRI